MENQLIESPSSEMQVINDQKMELFRERVFVNKKVLQKGSKKVSTFNTQ